MSLTSDFFNGMEKRKKKKYDDDIAPIRTKTTLSGDDIAPPTMAERMTAQTVFSAPVVAPEKEWYDKIVKKPELFDDGYQAGDIAKTILGTTADFSMNVLTGVGNFAEGIGDTINYGIADIFERAGNKDLANALKEETKKSVVQQLLGETTAKVDKWSVLGDTSDSVAQGLGMITTLGAGGMALGGAGIGAVGQTALSTGGTLFSGIGSGMSEAYEGGATDKEARTYGLIAGTAEALSEMIFGGLGKGIKAVGFSKGLSSADDMLAKKVSNLFSSQIAKNLAQYGIKAGAEGFEEVLSGIAQGVGKKITYMSEKELGEILKDENLLEQFVVGSVTSAIAQSGDFITSAKTGTDFITGLTENEQKVVDKEVENRIAEREEKGEKVTNKDKSKIYDKVVADLDKGYISIDTIESALGGETYKSYKDTLDNETALKEEFDTLNKMKQGEMTGVQLDRRTELKQQLEELKNNSKKTELKDKLSNDVFALAKDSRLVESYNEKARRGKSFEADLSKYDTKQQEVIKKAVESGILNNTNRTHEFVDMVAKISADKGVLFDFTNNEKLKNSGFALKGKTVNGYKTEDGNIALNMQSQKALESVVGHEITHILEGTELYSVLQEAVKQYATTKGEYVDRMQSLRDLYTDVYKGKDFDDKLRAELTADIVGDYLFSDSDFINSLSTEQPNLFKKIYNEIKYLCKVATAGSKEARELEKVKKAFDNAWKESSTAQKNTVESEKTLYSLNDNLENVGKILYDNNNPLAIVNRAKSNNKSSINWVYKSEIFSVTENKLFHEKISEINQGSQAFEKNSRDEYMLPIGNKIIFTDGNYESPYIRKIVEVLTEYSTDFEDIKECIYSVEKGESEQLEAARYVQNTFGEGCVVSYKSGNNGVFEWESGKRKGKSRRTVVRNYLNKQYRTGNDKQSQETQINEIAPKETSSKDGVFSNGEKTQYSLSEETDYSRASEMQTEVNQLTQSIKEIENSEEFKLQMNKLTDAIDNDDADNGIKAYKQWEEESGYRAIREKRDALREEIANFNKRMREDYSRKALEEEKNAIAKSGLSEADYFRKQAVKEFGYTPYFYDAGYIIPNGKMLNFSGEKGKHFSSRGQDHRAISTIYAETSGTDALNRFMRDGNIRIMESSPGIDISTLVEPTNEQYSTIRKFIYEYIDKEYFNIDFTDESGKVIGSLEYENRINPTRILNDIKHFYSTGEIRGQSDIEKYLYSLSKEGEQPTKNGRFYGKDMMLEKSGDLPIRQDVAKNTTTTDLGDIPIRKDITPKEETVEDNFEFEEYPITEVKTNRGVIPIKEYRDIIAMQWGYDDYADMRKHGVRFGDQYDDDYVPLAPTRKKASEQEWQDYYDMLGNEESTTTSTKQSDIVPIMEELPDTKIDDTTLKGIGQRLRETLSLTAKETKAIQEVVQKYSTTGLPDKTKIFDDIKEEFGEKVWRERNEEIAEVKQTLKGFKIKVSDEIKSDITDYSDWKKKHQGRLNFSQDGLTVDDVYMGLSISYPGLFPEDIINPTDQLLRMAELAENDIYSTASQEVDNDLIQQATDIIYDEVSKYKENELSQKAIEEQGHFYRGMVEEAEGSTAKTVKERIADEVKNARAELLMNQQLRDESQADFEKEISRLQAVYNGKRDKNTKVANDTLRRIERLQRMKNDVAADYSKRISDIENRIAKLESKDYATVEQRKTKQQELQSQMENLVGDTSTWVDKKLGISYKVNTLRRNLRDIVRNADGKKDIAKADAIYDELQGKYNHNEAELNREANRIKQQFAKIKITKAEDTYIQMLGELRHNPETTLTEDVVKDFYNKHKKNIDEAKVDKAIEMARPLYDELLSRVNQVLSEQGMKEIPYRKGYFPHFTEDKQGILGKLLNWKTKNNDIPTDIAGLTEEFSPNRSWQSFNKQRKSDTTDYSFLKGLDTYVQGSLDWIYHIEDIQKRRALENHIRYVHSEQGIKERIDAIRNNEEYDANEMQDQIDIVYKEAGNPLNNFITDFRTATNTLAGKKSSLDRGMEEMTNRKFYSTMTNLSNRVSANMVGGSISSALTNFIPITQSWGQVSPISSLRAMGETIVSTFRDDGTINKSDFLTNRLRQSENLYKTNWDKAGEVTSFLMESIDSFTSQTVWRSKYLENISNGMSENEAIKNADQFAENVLAGRSRGNNPTIFDSKNPLAKTLTVFQLEVNNQYGYMFKDMPQDLANESKRKLVQGYVTMFLGAYAYNALYSSLVGRDAAFDPIGIIEDLMRDLGVIGGDDEEEEEIAPADVITNLAENITEELPFVGGLLGGGRIPLSSALPYGGIKEAFDGTLEDLSEGNIKGLTKEWLNPVYYLAMPMLGGQIKKTTQGLKMFDDDLPIAGSYTDSGNLRFPVEDTPQNKVQAALFGQYANKNARKYFDDDIAPLNEKQIKEYADLDLPIADYWKYREKLKDFKTQDEKVAYINGLEVTEEQKNTLKSYLYDEEGYKEDNPEKYAFLESEGIGFLGYKEADDETQDAWSWAFKHQDEYRYLKENGVNPEDYSVYYSPRVEFDDEGDKAYEWAFDNPEKATIGKAFGNGVKEYRQYTNDLYNLKADKDSKGNSISGSKKKKVLAYINGLDIDYGAKCILLKKQYPAEDRYNKVIFEYIKGRSDITYAEKKTILEELGATVDSNGNVRW